MAVGCLAQHHDADIASSVIIGRRRRLPDAVVLAPSSTGHLLIPPLPDTIWLSRYIVRIAASRSLHERIRVDWAIYLAITASDHTPLPPNFLLYVDVSHLSFLHREQIADSCSEIDKCGMLQFAAKRQGISIYSPTLDHALIQPIWVYSMQQQLG